MKKSKWFALAGVSLLSVGVLVACSSKSNTSSNTYNYVYTADPVSGAYSQVGPKGSDRYFKYLEPQKDVVTKKNYDKARENWLKEKSKSNEEAQKDLEKHVK